MIYKEPFYSERSMEFGYGVFETLLVENGEIVEALAHYNRMKSSCEKLEMKLEDDLYSWIEKSRELVSSFSDKGVLKWICCYRDNEVVGYITSREYKYLESDFEKGFKIIKSDYKKNPYDLTTYLKTTNYMSNLIARKKCIEIGANEVIFLNTDGYIAEGSVSNIFWVKDGNIYTPEISCGLLAGIMRGIVIEASKKNGIKVIEGNFKWEELLASDEIFLTNSLMKIMPVSEVENHKFDLSSFKIYNSLRNSLR